MKITTAEKPHASHTVCKHDSKDTAAVAPSHISVKTQTQISTPAYV